MQGLVCSDADSLQNPGKVNRRLLEFHGVNIRQEARKCVSKHDAKYGSYGKSEILCGKIIQLIEHLGPGITKESTTQYERGLENSFLKKQFNSDGR